VLEIFEGSDIVKININKYTRIIGGDAKHLYECRYEVELESPGTLVQQHSTHV